MGIFSGVLLASDWDGTLSYNGDICKRNLEAVDFFCKNGGLFTVCSGRPASFIQNFRNIIKPNTYIISLNGAIISHPDTDDILYKGYLPFPVVDIIDEFLVRRKFYNTVSAYFKDDLSSTTFNAETYLDNRHRFAKEQIYKLLFISDSPTKNLIAQSIMQNSYCDERLLMVKSWDMSLEILSKESSKGYGLMRVAEKTASKLTIGVGDYENDIQLLQMADISYAVENAIDIVKRIATKTTVSAADGAVGAIVEDLYNDIASGVIRL